MNALGLEVSLDARGGLETLTIKNCETPPCLWDAGRLAQQGALAIWATPKGLRLVSGLEKDAHRPWGRKPDTE